MFISLAASENKERCRSNGGVLAVLQAQMVPMLPATQTTRDHTPPAPPSSHQTSHSAAEQSQGDIFVGKKKKKIAFGDIFMCHELLPGTFLPKDFFFPGIFCLPK